MGLLDRRIFREVASSALLGTTLFTFVLFLQKLGRLFELLVRSSADPGTVAYLFLLVLPPALTFSIPVGVLVGVLLATNRMSSDGEVIALRAAGIPSRRLLAPMLALASIATVAAASATLWLTPLSIRETYRVLNRLLAEQVTAEIQPRVFEESFPNTILYVGDVVSGPVVRWRHVFLAEMGPSGDGAASETHPRITVATEAVAVADTENNRIQLSMIDGRSYVVGEDNEYNSYAFPRGERVLEARAPQKEEAKPFTWMDTGPLIAEARKSVEARIELHQRLALPPACLLLALLGVPLGVFTRKAGKSSAFVLTVLVAFLYYMALISLIGMAKQERLPVELAVWTPNLLLGALGLLLAVRQERPGDRDLGFWLRGRAAAALNLIRRRWPARRAATRGARSFLPVLPQIIDAYVLRSFLFYFAVLLASFVALTHVFTFFELLGDIIKNQIPMSRVLTYHFFLTPKLIYDSAPVSVLVAVLVTFGVMSKYNEVTAVKACGISLYRLSVPVLMAGVVLSGALFAFDHYYVTEANRIQDGIRSEIKGRPPQTYLSPERQWIFGQGSRIYYYRYFDPAQQVMYGITVFELEPETFHLRRHVYAERARWEPSLSTWIFQDGWSRELDGVRVVRYDDFSGEARTFSNLTEPPGYFLKEVKQDQQMNFSELAAYIDELRQSGFDTIRLQVRFHKKFSVPLFALIMALISVPFAFLAGPRGAMAGVGVSFGIAIAYWVVSQLFEQVGNLNQLPPVLAAWAPDAIFALAGLYLFTHMRT